MRCSTLLAELKGDREIVMEAVKQSGWALQYASAELQGDRETLEAVKQYGVALEYALAELKGDREIVMAAVKQNGFALRHASAELQGDEDYRNFRGNIKTGVHVGNGQI